MQNNNGRRSKQQDQQQIENISLSTNVNDYDTGEPILEGSIRKTMTKNKIL